MTRQRALRLAREWSQGHVCSLRDGEAAEYHSMFAVMLEEAPPNEPMTLEQLQKMNGQPVWCEWLLPEDRAVENGKWFIVIIGDKTGLEIKRPADYGNYFLKTEDYGKGWLAYRYPTVATDTDVGSTLKEWEPCDECRNKCCFNCLYDNLSMQSEPCNSCDGDKWETKHLFCPNCGRPLTPEACAMQEKRLRGRK